jgi:hypothetical protein
MKPLNTMKPLNKIFTVFLSFILIIPGYKGFSQGAQKGDLSVAISYFQVNNSLPHLAVNVKTKVNGRFQPVGGITLKLYVDTVSTAAAIGTVVTGENGDATTFIPPLAKKEWGGFKTHTFLATFDGDKKFEATKANLTVAPAKMLVATTGKVITATLLQLKDNSWIPVKGVDVKIGVRRLGGDLPVNETPTFTTDSLGNASADFKRDSLPGDSKGNIVLVAKVEDNDQFGNLATEKTVPWGVKSKYESTFNEHTLFATRDKAPGWLILISSCIIIGVWLTLILLVRNIFRIRKIGQLE